jgi:hypothetical protein
MQAKMNATRLARAIQDMLRERILAMFQGFEST